LETHTVGTPGGLLQTDYSVKLRHGQNNLDEDHKYFWHKYPQYGPNMGEEKPQMGVTTL